jgi:transposase-like protein
MVQGIDFYGNCNHRKAHFKQILQSQEEPEVIIDDWIRIFCQSWLQEEFTCQRGQEYYARPNSDYANGYYSRRLLTSRGAIDLRVPRSRSGKYKFSLFESYRRYSRCFEDVVTESLLLGHSSRDAKRFFDGLFGAATISHALASNILRRYDHEIEVFKNRPIDKKAVILVIDAVHLKGAITGIKRAKPVLCAWCVWEDDTEELIDFEPAGYESAEAYSRFCARIYKRGLQDVRLVVSDDCDGIKEAVATFWPQAIRQGCVFHLMQNFVKALKGLDKRIKRKIIDDAGKIYETENKTRFYGLLKWFMAKYSRYKNHPAFKYLYAHLEETSQFYEIERKYWPAAKTSNRLERTFKEIKRRVKAFGRFPNTRSCQRWLYALIKEQLIPQYRGIQSTHNS